MFRASFWVLVCAIIAVPSNLASAQLQQKSIELQTMPEQASQPRIPAYEVVSIRRHKNGDETGGYENTPDGFRATNISLLALISQAYGVNTDMIVGGPSWSRSAGFDVQAKIAPSDIKAMAALNPQQQREMLKPVLSDRFGLKVHGETRPGPVFDLVVSPRGLRLTPTKSPIPGGPAHNPIFRPGEYESLDAPIPALAYALSVFCKRPVVDKTGLTGRYDISLRWNSLDTEMAGIDSSQGTLPSLYTAIEEQLGLKLRTATAPLSVLVIDHVELPSEN